jgi:dTDP-4-amino-4,6-dideoxygalactose transaminase
MEPVNLFVPSYRIDETLSAIRECLEVGWTGMGFKTVELERAWCAYTGLPYAHFVNSATAGLHLAVRVLKERDGWADGDEIISTPLTFVSTNHVLLWERLQPVFADVDEYLCLDPASIAARLTPRTRAVMFVGLGGNIGRLDPIVQWCRARGLRLIVDASHMAGTRHRGQHVGAEADATVFSFHAVKNMPTADSGMICFRDDTLDREVRRWTWLGIDRDTYARTTGQGSYQWYYDVIRPGFKYHGNSIMAAIGLVSLRYLDADNARRRELASIYDESLDPAIARVPMAPDCEPSRHLFQILVERRDEVMQALNAHQIYPGMHYRINTDYPMYSGAAGSCPRAEEASRRVISLPLHLSLADHDARRVSTAVNTIVQAMSPVSQYVRLRRGAGHG